MHEFSKIHPSVLFGILSALRATDGIAYKQITQRQRLTAETVRELALGQILLGDLPLQSVLSEIANSKYYKRIMLLAGKESFCFLNGRFLSPIPKTKSALGLLTYNSAVSASVASASRLAIPAEITAKRRRLEHLIEINNSPFVFRKSAEFVLCEFYCGYIGECVSYLARASVSMEETYCAAQSGGTICHFALSKRL